MARMLFKLHGMLYLDNDSEQKFYDTLLRTSCALPFCGCSRL